MDIDTTCAFCGSDLVRRKQAKDVKVHFCGMTCKSSYQKLAKPVSEGWLRGKYITDGLDCTQISRLVNRDPKSVWNWLKDFGIPTRPRGARGGAASRAWVKGAPSLFTGRTHSEENKQKARAARLKDGRIPAFINGVHWLKATGRKPATWKGGISPERQKVYSSCEWKAAVIVVWHRDDARCRRCGLDHRTIDRSKTKFHVHHVDSFQIVERRVDPDNLVLLCDKCHRWVHGKHNKGRVFIGKGH